MLRAALELIVTLVVIYLVRSVITILAKAFSGASGAAGTSQAGPRQGTSYPGGGRPASAPQASELKKDPVCGTFVSTAVALQKTTGGETHYFCSAECRDKFRG